MMKDILLHVADFLVLTREGRAVAFVTVILLSVGFAAFLEWEGKRLKRKARRFVRRIRKFMPTYRLYRAQMRQLKAKRRSLAAEGIRLILAFLRG